MLHSNDKTRHEAGFCDSNDVQNSGWSLDIRRLLAFRTLDDVKSHFLAFLQSLEAIHLDRREMREQILSAFVWRDETETFRVVKPLNSTVCNTASPNSFQQQLERVRKAQRLTPPPPHKLSPAFLLYRN